MNVLIVDDNDEAAELLEQALASHGYATRRVSTGGAALRELPGATLVLLALGLPDLAGHEVCRRIRESSSVPVIVMSDDGSELDRVLALHMGADDIVRRPDGHYELLARIQALMRRSASCAVCAARRATHTGTGTGTGAVRDAEHAPPPTRTVVTQALRVGELRLDPAARLVLLGGREVRVTRREFDLLAALVANPGVVLERRDIISRVWGENWFGSTRTIDVHVGSLRGKLGCPEWIQTVRGVGYKLTAPGPRAD
ncbi:response regulator [Streptomyces sp. SID8358]|uniref:response regulator transcription factor n=1 Tax=Streptomyces sp. SID8358 TaxID=2690342 RepID=UPI000DAD362B|nr:response regulator transcription factor [Streptomyces sp. SID8358]MYU35903.1 response regulator [Streptomyces sp. SID8358]